jgi:hypothetical protein
LRVDALQHHRRRRQGRGAGSFDVLLKVKDSYGRRVCGGRCRNLRR